MSAAALDIVPAPFAWPYRQPGHAPRSTRAARARLEALGARRIRPGKLAPPRSAPVASRVPSHAISSSL